MRVLAVVSGQKWLGGLTIQTALLCRELERLGHQVAVISIGQDAVVDQFRHARVRYGPEAGLFGFSSNGHGTKAMKNGHATKATKNGHSPEAMAEAGGEYVFRYEVVADAARYLPPGPGPVRAALAPLARLGMAVVAPPPDSSRAPVQQARGAAASFARGLAAALDAGLSGGAAEAPFLARLLLNTEKEDLDRLEEIRRWFQPDVEYACDLALVPMLARLEDRGIPLIAAAQGFEIVQRRGVGLLDALRAARHRLDLVLSGSQANIAENLNQIAQFINGSVPSRPIPYGVALDGGWEMERQDAVARLRELEAHLTLDQRGAGGLWGEGYETSPPFIITCLSRIDVEKGADLALHALSILRQQGVPARLWIAGNAMPGSAYMDVLRTKIRLMDLGYCVSLIATVRDQLDKVALLRASDAFVAGFIRSEPFGLVYTEAFACGLPVVAPASGAAPEIMAYVDDTSTLYPVNDTGAMAQRLKALYESPARRAEIGERERRAFLTRFNATEMAKGAAAEFERAIARRAGRPHALASTR
ncbi:MAG TPA: glycosyltransferase [Chloroflexota bacterium]|nr:glycosyltransferase [Chloroflexota bacterium]